MKKGLKIGLVFGTLLMLIAIVFAGSANACIQPPPPPPQSSDLMAGKFDYAGYVEADDDGTNLYISYVGDDGWTITETHLWVGDNTWKKEEGCDIPRTNKGNLKIGHFPYKNQMSYEISLAGLDKNGDGKIFIVAHAEVEKWVRCELQQETAWADTGFPIPDVNGWALYFEYTI